MTIRSFNQIQIQLAKVSLLKGMCYSHFVDGVRNIAPKGTSINDVRRFLEIFDLTYLPFSTLKRPIFWVILDPPTYPKIGRH